MDTDNTDESLQIDLRTPERPWLRHGNNMSRSLTNRNKRNTTIIPLRITDKGIG